MGPFWLFHLEIIYFSILNGLHSAAKEVVFPDCFRIPLFG